MPQLLTANEPAGVKRKCNLPNASSSRICKHPQGVKGVALLLQNVKPEKLFSRERAVGQLLDLIDRTTLADTGAYWVRCCLVSQSLIFMSICLAQPSPLSNVGRLFTCRPGMAPQSPGDNGLWAQHGLGSTDQAAQWHRGSLWC